MNARLLFVVTALAAAIAASLYHVNASRARTHWEGERTRALADAAEAGRLADEISRRVAAAGSALRLPRADEASHAERTTNGGRATPIVVKPAPSARPAAAAAAHDPELHRLQVHVFVSEQRLRFGALLQRLGFTSEKLRKFDEINAAYRRATLNGSLDEFARQQIVRTREADLQELFGQNFDQLTEANRNQPARAVVEKFVQQTFQGSGALTTGQADELTRIVGQHQMPVARDAGVGQPRYDWDRIIADARSILADRQMADFITAIEFRRTSDKMAAIAARKKS